MIQFVVIVLVLFAIVFGLEWLKDEPGGLAFTYADTIYQVGLAETAVFVILALLLVVGIAWLIRTLFRAPARTVASMRAKREERGRDAIAEGLLAVASGDATAAERAMGEARRLQPRAPLTRLLEAQTAQLKGDHDTARQSFAAMLEAPQTRVAGLRGLYLEADHLGEQEAARYYAEQAREASPSAGWATRAMLRRQTAAGDWDGALRTLATYSDQRTIDKKTSRRLRAVILTAQAKAAEEGSPQKAKQAALEAHDLAPDLVPAAVIGGRVLARLGELRRAANILEETWKVSPHPEVAETYAYLRTGDSTSDRLRRVEALQKMRPQDDAGRVALARAALLAQEFELARTTLSPVLTSRPTRGALELMAEIEEGEHGDEGRSREWLQRAVRAAPDPVWTADGVVLDEWQPVSPVTGALDAVEWKAPAARAGGEVPLDPSDHLFQPRALLSTGRSEEAHPAIARPEEAPPVAARAQMTLPPRFTPAPDAVEPAAMPSFLKPPAPLASGATGLENDASVTPMRRREDGRAPDDPGVGEPAAASQRSVSRF